MRLYIRLGIISLCIRIVVTDRRLVLIQEDDEAPGLQAVSPEDEEPAEMRFDARLTTEDAPVWARCCLFFDGGVIGGGLEHVDGDPTTQLCRRPVL